MTARGSAIRYARALFDVGLQEGVDLESLQRELSSFSQLMSEHESLQRALVNPAIPASKKRAVVEALLQRSSGSSPQVARLLLLLADRDRLALMPELTTAFEQRLTDHRQVVRAELSTAIELPGDRVAALKNGLVRATGREVLLDTRVDPALVGGAVARIGSTVYDGSVVTQLQKLKQSLIESAQ